METYCNRDTDHDDLEKAFPFKLGLFLSTYPPKIDMSPEKGQKDLKGNEINESSGPTINFQGIFVSFQGGSR